MSDSQLAPKDIHGLLNLLKAEDEKTLNLIAQQLKSFDASSLKTLNELAKKSDDSCVVDNWYYVSKQSLKIALQEWKKKGDLEDGLFILSRLENPGINEKPYKEKLEKLASRVKENIKIDSSSKEIVKIINEVIFEEENFAGNQIFYYDIKNNFLDSVIDTRTGNPITLSALYILVARRAGLDVRGIGTPGHFIVKHEDTFIDPFFNGREITSDECHIRAQELGVFWRDEYLEPIDDLAIISRSLRNLVSIYKRNKNYEKASDVSELIGIL